MRHPKHLVLASFLFLLAACGTMPGQPPILEIDYQAIGSAAGFSFLPPVGSSETATTNFNPSISVSIAFYQLGRARIQQVGSALSTADGSIEAVTTGEGEGYYSAEWQPRVPAGSTVRVEVRLATARTGVPACTSRSADIDAGCLAFFDVRLWANEKQMQAQLRQRQVPNERVLDWVMRDALPIHFHVSQEACLGQVLQFQDESVHRAVASALGHDLITCSDMQHLTELTITSAGEENYCSLEGLQYASRLERLNVDCYSISPDAEPVLRKLISLREVNLLAFSSRISLSWFSNLEHLEKLSLASRDADAPSSGFHLPHLTHLAVSGIYPGTIDLTMFGALSLPALTHLNVSAWELTADLSPLASTNLPSLTHLSISADSAYLSSIAPLVEADFFSRLQTLALTSTTAIGWTSLDITALAFVSMSDLQELDLSGNLIRDITPLALASMPALSELNINNNLVTDVSALVNNSSLAAMAWLDLSNNCLDITNGSQARQDIDALVEQGITVIYAPQGNPFDWPCDLDWHVVITGPALNMAGPFVESMKQKLNSVNHGITDQWVEQ